VITNSQIRYFELLSKWSDFNKCLINYTENNSDVNLDLINMCAWNIATFCNEEMHLENGLIWAIVLQKGEANTEYLWTYSRLLYKSGQKELAIDYMKKIV